jgi:hypothetical protein
LNFVHKKQIPINTRKSENEMKSFLALLLLAPLAASTVAERKPFVEAIPTRVNPESGSKVVQLTSQPVISINVNMEHRFASTDGRRIAIERPAFEQPLELWVCDLNTTRLYRIEEGRARPGPFKSFPVGHSTTSLFPTMAVSSWWTTTVRRRSTSAASRPAGSSSCAIPTPAREGHNTRTLCLPDARQSPCHLQLHRYRRRPGLRSDRDGCVPRQVDATQERKA